MKPFILVLAHPRTGSSLLMQTVNIIGIPIQGSTYRDDLPTDANPKGYFEDLGILSKGIKDELFDGTESTLEGKAVKVALYNMVKNDRTSQWQRIATVQPKILIPIRDPIESALSSNVFKKCDHHTKQHFYIITQFMHHYFASYRALSEILCNRYPTLIQSIKLIQFDLAFSDPYRYLREIADFLGIHVDRKTTRKAINNIDPNLYRYKRAMVSQYTIDYNRNLRIDQVYTILRSSHGMERWRAIMEL